MTNTEPTESYSASLSERDRELLICLASGMTQSEIARSLSYSQSAVKQELTKIRHNLRAKTTLHAVVIFLGHDVCTHLGDGN